MPRLELTDASIAYEVRGTGSPITFLHGFAQRGDVWKRFPGADVADHQRLTVDLRGHGATRVRGGAPYSMDACADDVIALWDRLNLGRCRLAGYSMGGRLALHIATRYPQRLSSLTVISAHAGLDDAERHTRRLADERLAQDIERRGIAWFAEHWDALPLFATLRARRPDLVEPLRHMRLASDPAGLAASLREMGAGAMAPLWGELERVACPALVIAGADDSRYVALARRLGAALPDARVEIVRDAGHAAHLERPEIVGALLTAFVREVDDRSDVSTR